MSSPAVFTNGTMLQGMGPQGQGSLESMGLSLQKSATAGLAEAANMETRRNAANLIANTERKQGNQQLAGTVGGVAGGAIAGATLGTAAGPWGSLIGGLVGALAGHFMG